MPRGHRETGGSGLPWLGICLAWGLAACGPAPTPPSAEAPLAEDEVVMRGVTFDRFDGDVRLERVRARRMVLDRKSREISADDVVAERFDPEAPDRAKAVVSAPKGHLDAERRQSKLFGGVRVDLPGEASAPGRTLQTERLFHDGPQDRLHTEDPVTVRGADFQLEGRGMELRPGEDTVRIGGPVQAVMTPSGQAPR